jgi:hypothetical protein
LASETGQSSEWVYDQLVKERLFLLAQGGAVAL